MKKTKLLIFLLCFLATSLSILFLAGCQKTPALNYNPAKDGNQFYQLRQIAAADNAASRTIMWQTKESAASSWIEYRIQGSSGSLIAQADEELFTDDNETSFLHTAFLDDLSPDTVYEYRACQDNIVSGWQSLRTPGKTITALIFPDSQSADYNGFAQLASDALHRNPDTELCINMGDLVDNGADKTQWHDWFTAMSSILPQITFAPVMGNHETYTKDWQVRLPEAWLRFFAVPKNGSQTHERWYYSFDYGAVHFIVLNTQWDELDTFAPGLLAEEIEWMKDDCQKSSKPWKIVLMHKDILTYGINGRPERTPGFSDVGLAFQPVFDQLGIDVVLSAHLHTYRNRGQIHNFQPANKGPLYILTGVSGDVRYPGLWIDSSFDQKIAPQPETDNYLIMKADPGVLSISACLPDGTVIDDVTLSQKNK